MPADPWAGLPPGLSYGGDYNPEQWPRETWREDARLMREAGVNLVSVGIFGWAATEPTRGVFDFAWLDEVLDLLHDHGVSVDLATPTAAPPAWLYAAHPDAWVTDASGVRLGPGSRGAMCPSSPAYRGAAAAITEALADRYARHPAVVLFHVHNEYGAPVLACHCEHSQRAFRAWLLDRHGDLAGLNDAWGTAFWGQRYSDIEEVRTPAASASVVNPAQQLDFARFNDHELRACFRAERDILKRHAPAIPVTTNFMASSCPGVDYWTWAQEVDVVSNDHYLTGERRDAHVLLSLDADLTRSLAGGRPWLLMEHSTSAVNWQPRNIAKRPGEMARNALAHLARGADGIMFFQWRASRSGAEKFHSAMLPHGGTSTRVWREVTELGDTLGRLAAVRGSRTSAEVAILWDWESFWAQDLEWRPSVDLDHRERIEAFYRRLWDDGVTVDFVHPDHDLTGYRLVIAPQLYLVTARSAANLHGYVRDGGHLLVSYFSGVVDEHDRVHPQGLSGPLGDTLGLRVEEFHPLRQDESVTVSWTSAAPVGDASADVWTEQVVTVPGTEVLATFATGPVAGTPAVTRSTRGGGVAWYVATRLHPDGLAHLLGVVCAEAGVARAPSPQDGLEVVQRSGPEGTWLFALNHGDVEASVAVEAAGVDAITGEAVAGTVPVLPGGTRVVMLSPPA